MGFGPAMATTITVTYSTCSAYLVGTSADYSLSYVCHWEATFSFYFEQGILTHSMPCCAIDFHAEATSANWHTFSHCRFKFVAAFH